jgi:hypothetical protein
MWEATAKQLSALSRLFSSSVIHEMAMKGRSALFARLLRELDGVVRPLSRALVRDVFESAFEMLRHGGRRAEYIYKAALTHRVLMGRHSLRMACMLSEFRTGECKADIAILNRTTTVYEIKSEWDSLTRLKRQIENYRKVFATVFVIAGERHVTAVLRDTPSDFETLAPELVHSAMLATLKRTRDMQPLASLVDRLPRSLQAAALSVPLRKGDHDRFVATLNTPLRHARAWS